MVRNVELAGKISAYNIGNVHAELSFSKRLARDNDWTDDFSTRVIEEYKKFIYLMAISDRELTPSDEVDQAWHLHLAYTRDYWEEFCSKVIGKPMHHGPTQGGSSENTRYKKNYNATLKLYEKEFGHPPTQEIWPPEKERFRRESHYFRINSLDFYIEKGKRSSLKSALVLASNSIVTIVIFAFFAVVFFTNMVDGVITMVDSSVDKKQSPPQTVHFDFYYFIIFCVLLSVSSSIISSLFSLSLSYRPASERTDNSSGGCGGGGCGGCGG